VNGELSKILGINKFEFYVESLHGKYRWPRNSNEAKNITWQQFDWLMSGLEIEQ